MKILGIGDIHFQNTYSHRLDNVKSAFENKCGQIHDYCMELQVDVIVITGDVFNSKNPHNSSHEFIGWVMDIMDRWPADVYSIVGNHDIQQNDMGTLYKQPINTLFHGPVSRIPSEGFFYPDDNNSYPEANPNIYGFDYGTDFSKLSKVTRPDKEFGLGVTHCYMSKKPGKFFNEKSWGFNELSHLGLNMILNGHDHSPYPIASFKGMTILRPGALFRSRFDEVDLNRKLQVALIDGLEGEAIYLPIRNEPSNKIFDLKARQRQKKESEKITNFMAALQNEKIGKRSISEELNNMDIEPPVKEVIKQYLDEVKDD